MWHMTPSRSIRICDIVRWNIDAEGEPTEAEAAKGRDEGGKESGLWAKWDLPEATLGVKLAKNLALSQFGQALVK